MSIIFISILIILIFELILVFYIKNLKNNFQWLITKQEDLNIQLATDKIEKFKINSYDKFLGWSPRPNKIRYDLVKSFGEKSKKKFKKVKYRSNKFAARFNPGFENKREKIVTFGDSFVFARHVNDNETWQNKLSKLTNSNVTNFGVGNYGVDQSILKMEKDLKGKSKKIVILGFVPETIVRVHSIWRHFYEYGNYFAFKPRFKIKEKKLINIKNPIRKFDHIKKIKNNLDILIKNDYWFFNKFKKDLLESPFILTIFKNFPKNLLVIYYLTLSKVLRSKTKHNKAWEIILNENFKFVVNSYKKDDMVNLLCKEIELFSKKIKKNNSRPVVVIFPYLHDVNYIESSKNHFYYKLANKVSKYTDIIDLSNSFLKLKNRKKYFVNLFYGAHLSKKGNEFCAEKIYTTLLERKII